MHIDSGSSVPSAATEIVFVEDNLPDLQSVLAGVRPGVDVVLLDSAGDGLAQIADALRGRSGIDAIHIVSHGAPGALDLGSVTLSAATLADHADALGTIGAALAADGDILLYGCDAAAGDDGQALLTGLASLTRADVAASLDPTGAAAQGGDWQLEAHAGTIEASLCFTDAFTAQYDALLANARPTLGYISVIMGGKEDTPGVITFADLMAAASVSDSDGTVTAFRITGFYSGGTTFKVGTSLETAGSGINDVIIDATHNLYYTPPADYYSLPGSGIGMVEVVAVDNLGAQSFGSADVFVNLAAVNDAPSFGEGNHVQGVAEDTVSLDHEDVSDPANHPVANQGSDIASLMRNSAYQDKEYDAGGTGIAVAGNDADPLTQGRWQYSTDGNGEYWHDIGAVSAGSALLLSEGGGRTFLRFVPVADFSGTPGSLTVHAVDGSDPAMRFSTWDGSSEQRHTFDTTADDDASSPVSVSGVTWQTSVFPVNDIPVLTGLDGADDQTVLASDAAVLVDRTQDIALADVDNPDLGNGNVGVAISSGRDAGDVLAIRTDAEVALSAGMNVNSTVSVGGVAVGMIGVGATGAGQDLGIYLMGGATPDNIAVLLRHITFDATASVAGDRTITMQVRDGDQGTSAIGTTVVSVEVAPTVSITSNRSSLRAGDEARIIFTFSEAPSGFDVGDITVVGGTLRSFQNIGDPRMYDAVFVPTAGMQSTSASVSIAAGKFTGAQGTANLASTGNAAMTVDTKAPTLTIGADKTTVKAGDTVAVTFTFDEAPVGFAQGYVSYSGGVLSNFQATADDKVFGAIFTPSSNLNTVNATISVGANAYADAVGNRGTGSNIVVIGGDTKAPTVNIGIDKTVVKAGDTVGLTFTFSEAPAGFEAGDVSVSGGTLTNFQAGADSKVYTATFTPVASDALEAMINIGAGTYTDAVGNAGLASNYRLITGDTRGPSVVVESSAASLKAGETATVTFTFSEAPVGFDDAAIRVSGGTLGPIAASATDPKVYSATFTPTAGVDGVTASIAVTAGSHADSAGNAGAGGQVAIGVDTRAPTVAIGSDKSVLRAGETATVTFTFSEAPLHFDDADISVSGGSVTGLAPSADPKVYTATFTPTAGQAAVAASVGVAAGRFTDAAGNLNTASAVDVVFSGDTLAPTVSDAHLAISGGTGPDGAFRIGDVVSVRWDNGSAGDGNLDVAGVSVDFSAFGGGAAVAAVQGEDGVWGASFTIVAGQIDATGRNVAITVTDTAGNSVTRADSSGATVDNAAPLVSAGAIAVGGASGAYGTFRAGDTITVVWSGEANGDIAGVTVDFSAFGGAAAVAATPTAGGWSATFQLSAAALDPGARRVVLTATDDAGNAVTRAGADVAVDNAAPTVTGIVLAGTPAANATEVEFTVTLDEAVTGLDADDFTLVLTGATTARIAAVSGSGATYTVKVDGIAGNGTLRLDLNASDTGIVDLAGNAIGAGYSSGTAHATSFNAAPRIVSNAGGTSAEVGIAEGTRQVTTVVATDADHDPLSYSIAGGADAALFEIDAVTGVLALRSAQGHATPADSDHDGRYEVRVGVADGKGGSATQDLTVTVLHDLDGDGVPDVDDDDSDNDGGSDALEDAVPSVGGGHGDGNGDGRPDSAQLNVASLPTVVGTHPYATLEVAEGLKLTAVSAAPAPAALPRNVKLPLGVLDFAIEGVEVGGTVLVSVYVDSALQANAYYKQDNEGKWVNIARSVTTVGTGPGSKTRITFALTDGGAYDSDGVADGRIVDPGGAAQVAPLITSDGGAATASASTRENTVTVTTVTASAIGPVTYAIAGGADAALFQIDAATGVLTWRQAPDYELPASAAHDNRYVVQVSATDGAGSDVQTLTVSVLDDPELPPDSTPPPSTAMVDGVAVQTRTVGNGDGTTSQVLTIPIVTDARVEQVGNNKVADIPLATGAGGKAVLTALVPTGVGLSATGNLVPKVAGGALADLLRAIGAHTGTGSHDRAQLAAAGAGFLDGIAADTPLVVQALVPVAAPGGGTVAPSGEQLVIAGNPAGAGTPLSALVIDTRALASGATLELRDVGFAAIVGAAHVTGGAGAQQVWGDSAAQYIVLGAGDDVLHGGAGNDTVGGGAGDDRIHGDEGDDLVSGGAGNDTVDGGSGHDTALFSGAGRADYSLRVRDGGLVVTQLHGGADGSDLVLDVEALRFSGGADTSLRGTLARLAEAATGQPSDLLGTDRLLAAVEQGATVAQVARALLEASGMDRLDDAAFVDALYRNVLHREADAGGRAAWLAALDDGHASRAEVALMLAGSGEKLGMAHTEEIDFDQGDVATLVRMYGTLFGRQVDADGLNFWIGVYESGKSLAAIADAFVASGEAQAQDAASSNADFVARLYQTAFDRAAKPEELAYWTAGLDHGAVDRGDVLLDFANSAEQVALVGNIGTSIPVL